MISILLTERKKNGAHNHLSQLKKLGVSKYSRHVVLCKNNTNQKQQKTKTEWTYNQFARLIVVFDPERSFYENRKVKKKKRKRKKTEHTIISHNLRNSEHQNIHVMLSYAKKPTTNKKKLNTRSLQQSGFYSYLFVSSRRNYRLS